MLAKTAFTKRKKKNVKLKALRDLCFAMYVTQILLLSKKGVASIKHH